MYDDDEDDDDDDNNNNIYGAPSSKSPQRLQIHVRSL